MTMSNSPAPESSDRRTFCKGALAACIGGCITLAPIGAGIAVWLDPLDKKNRGGATAAVKVASLSALPNDGVPRKFSILARRTDAWTTTPETPIGAVYLLRTGDKTVEALNVVCPHAGCFVDYLPSKSSYLCPCHNSLFALDGKIIDPKSPSPRALDHLKVEIRNDSEIWVEFKNFLSGHSEQISQA